jgi:Putative MetA-pathway of phenol degradation
MAVNTWIWRSLSATLLLLPLLFGASASRAQMPFYTDNADVTPPKKLHVEIFDEVDGLQSSQFPDVRQNTANLRVNFSPISGLELDLDAPYITIYRAPESQASRGIGDTDLGAKWNFREAIPDSTRPAFSVSFYVEFPTGNAQQELGSGLTDYWLNFILEKPFSDTTRLNANLGVLFAGNTSTGDLGIQTRRGQVYTGGVSLLHDFTPRLTLGVELYGGVSDGAGQDKTQLQAMFGAQYTIRDGLTLCLGLLGGKYGATPQIGGQIGFSIDLPDAYRPQEHKPLTL